MTSNTSLNDTITTSIRVELARTGTTHAEFARQMGWHPMFFSRRMNGSVAFTTDEIDTIARELGIDRQQLISPVQR